MEISLKTYKQLYKAFLDDNNLSDDSRSTSAMKARQYLLKDMGQTEDQLLDLAMNYDIKIQHEDDENDDKQGESISFEIYFDDLSEDAQTRFRDAGLWHENIEMSPLAIFEYETDFEEN